jgi:hypothetical protein
MAVPFIVIGHLIITPFVFNICVTATAVVPANVITDEDADVAAVTGIVRFAYNVVAEIMVNVPPNPVKSIFLKFPYMFIISVPAVILKFNVFASDNAPGYMPLVPTAPLYIAFILLVPV